MSQAPASPQSPVAQRRHRLVTALKAQGLPAVVLTRGSDVRWATGFTGSAGAVLITVQGDAVFATDTRYIDEVWDLIPGSEPIVTRDPLADLFARGIDLGAAHVAIDADDLSWSQGRRLMQDFSADLIVDAGSLMDDLRASKDADEIAAIRRACNVTEQAVAELGATIRVGETESAIARRFVRLIDDLGADGPAFPPIVAAGPNAAVPHHRPGSRPLAVGDLLILDVGARVQGYCADLSRTFAIGSVEAPLVAAHATVKDAQAAGRVAARAGACAGDVDAAARAVIGEAGHGDRFTHGTGHGIGLDIHEPPILREGAAGILGESFVITVEPGIYLPGVGGARIEDTVIVGVDGAEPLTTLPRDLIVL